jgi:DNA-binding transcriptional regulator YdaS (Cro superfamily)
MSGFVYFVRCGDFVKIGFSKRPDGRLRYLRTATPFDFVLVGAHAATVHDERHLHKIFKAHRHRGEWFRWVPEIEQVAVNGLADEHRATVSNLTGHAMRASMAIQRAVQLKGSQEKLGAALNVSQAGVYLAIKTGQVSAEFARDLHIITDGEIHCSSLRPDLWLPSMSFRPEPPAL